LAAVWRDQRRAAWLLGGSGLLDVMRESGQEDQREYEGVAAITAGVSLSIRLLDMAAMPHDAAAQAS